MKHISLIAFMLLNATLMYAQQGTTQYRDTMLMIIQNIKIVDHLGRGRIEILQDVPGKKDELFVKAKSWVIKTYNSGRSVIQMEDKDGGIIIGKAMSSGLIYNNTGIKMDAGGFKYQITIQFKDGKYRCILDDITYEKGYMSLSSGADIISEYPDNWPSFGKKYNKKQWDSMKEQTLEYFRVVLLSLSSAMTSQDDNSKW